MLLVNAHGYLKDDSSWGERRDINETCHITTAPEIESRGINETGCIHILSVDSSLGKKREIAIILVLYTCELSSWGEKKRYQRD